MSSEISENTADLPDNRIPPNRSVVITGGSQGIGRSVAEAFAAAGFRVALVARQRLTLEMAAQAIRSKGGEVEIFAADVSKEEEVQRLFELLATWKGLDTLVNNAGLMNLGVPFWDQPLAEFHASMAGNVLSALLCSKYFARLLLSRKLPGVIINTGSRAASATDGFSPYRVAKAAVVAMTRQMAADLYPHGIKVNAIVPPLTDTPGTRMLGLTGEVMANAYRPESFTDLYLFLASDRGQAYSGRVIDAEGWMNGAYTELNCRRGTWKLECPMTDSDRLALGIMATNPLKVSKSLQRGVGLRIPPELATAYPVLRPEPLLGRLAEVHGVSPDEIVLGAGAEDLIRVAFATFGDDGGDVVYGVPGFVQIRNLCKMNGLNPVELNLDWDESSPGWGQVPLDAILRAINVRTRIIYLINPHNPTGSLIRRSSFEDFIRGVPTNVFVLVDEAYHGYLPNAETETFPASAFIGSYPNVVALRTFSKNYGLAGLRIGYAIAAEKAAWALARRQIPFVVSGVAQQAAEQVLADQKHQVRTQKYLAAERQRLAQALEEHGVLLLPSSTNLLTLRFGGDTKALVLFLKQHGVRARANPFRPDSFFYTVDISEENDHLLREVAAFFGRTQ